MIDLEAERISVNVYREVWLGKREALHKTLRECHLSHTTPPNNYWEEEYRARGKFLMAAKALAVLEGV